MRKRALASIGALLLVALVSLSFVAAQQSTAGLSPMEELGKRLFFDKSCLDAPGAGVRGLPRPVGRLHRPGGGD